MRGSRIRGGHGVPVASAVVAGGSGGGSPTPRGVGSCRGRVGTKTIPAARSRSWCRPWRSYVRPSPPPRRRHGGWASPSPSPSPPATRPRHKSQGGTSVHDTASCGEVMDATAGCRPEQVSNCQFVRCTYFDMGERKGVYRCIICRFKIISTSGKAHILFSGIRTRA